MAEKYKYIDFQRDDGVAVVRLRGKDFHDTVEVRACGEEIAGVCRDARLHDVVVDFTDMRVVPSSVFAALVVLYKRLHQRDARLHVCCLDQDTLNSFYVLNLHTLMTVHANLDEALAAAHRAGDAA